MFNIDKDLALRVSVLILGVGLVALIPKGTKQAPSSPDTSSTTAADVNNLQMSVPDNASSTAENITDPVSESAAWWVANSDFTECHESGGPAEKLDSLVGYIDQPTTRDFRDQNGNLEKVEVVVPEPGGMERVTTYFKSKALCMAEDINRTQNLANQYR